jgi:hypothetical protein
MPKNKIKLTPEDVDVSPVLAVLEEISIFAGDCDDWVTVKREVMQRLNPGLRRLFSTRDPLTKEQSMNSFEIMLAAKFYEHTGTKLILRTREERRQIYGSI